MNQPKLKYPRLCRLLTYIVVIGFWTLPIVIVCQFPLHDLIRVVVIFASLICLLVYLFKNIMILMMMDMMLAMLSCHRTARTCYHLPKNRTAEAIRRSILRYGTECQPTAIKPTPAALRYLSYRSVGFWHYRKNPLHFGDQGHYDAKSHASCYRVLHYRGKDPIPEDI